MSLVQKTEYSFLMKPTKGITNSRYFLVAVDDRISSLECCQRRDLPAPLSRTCQSPAPNKRNRVRYFIRLVCWIA